MVREGIAFFLFIDRS